MKRFSLRSLVLSVFLLGSLVGFLLGYSPWVATHSFRHASEIWKVSFNYNGSEVLTASRDGIARLWDVYSGILKFELKSHDGPFASINFSKDGRILTAESDASIKLWDKGQSRLIKKMENLVKCAILVFSEKRPIIITYMANGSIRVMDENGETLYRLQSELKGIQDAIISEDERQLLDLDDFGVIRFWDLRTGLLLKTLYLPDKTSLENTHADFDENGLYIKGALGFFSNPRNRQYSYNFERTISHSNDTQVNSLIIMKTQSLETLAELIGHSKEIRSYAFSPVTDMVITGSDDQTAKLWYRRRPEEWWGIIYLWWFWLVLFLSMFLVISIKQDKKSFI